MWNTPFENFRSLKNNPMKRPKQMGEIFWLEEKACSTRRMSDSHINNMRSTVPGDAVKGDFWQGVKKGSGPTNFFYYYYSYCNFPTFSIWQRVGQLAKKIRFFFIRASSIFFFKLKKWMRNSFWRALTLAETFVSVDKW